MTWESLLAALALLIGVIALWAALSARATARRVADALLGDVDDVGRDDDPEPRPAHAAPDAGHEADHDHESREEREPREAEEGRRHAAAEASGIDVVEDRSHQPPVIVVNPTKTDVEELRHIADRTTAMLGFPEARILETTVEDPGTGQARRAVEEGAQVVIAAGGDGTVRAVAEGLMHSDVPMGLLPLGTGNLLATNLDLTGISDRELLTIALTGRERPIDMGVLHTEALTGPELDHLKNSTNRDDSFGVDAPTDGASAHYLVIGGLGFDAVMVGGVDDHLKKRLGIVAYPVYALRHLFDHRIKAELVLNREATQAANPDQPIPVVTVDARSIMFANCGRLMSGVTLVPSAQVDDGWLDIVVMDTRGGIKGWLDLTNKVLLQGAGRRSNLAVLKDARIDSHRARTATVRTRRPHPVQVDGDILSLATTIHTEVVPDALLVRTSH